MAGRSAWAKLAPGYMFGNTYYMRRTKFILYWLAIAFARYNKMDLGGLVNFPGTHPDAGDAVGVFSYELASATILGLHFGFHFLFDLFAPERAESRATQWYWKLGAVAAVLLQLGSALAITVVTATMGVKLDTTGPAELAAVRQGYHGPATLRYRDNAQGIAAVVFGWLGFLFAIPCTIIMWRVYAHNNKHGPFTDPKMSMLSQATPSRAALTGNASAGAGAASSVFVSPARDLLFALNVPNDSATDLFFSLVLPIHITWGAVGLGSDRMAGALTLIAYRAASGENLTLSPRLAPAQAEPVYAPDIDIEALPGTGLVDDGTNFVFNGRCGNCRTWRATGGPGSIDAASTSQAMIYATGARGDLRADDPAAPLRFHADYGSFAMDLARATGPGGVPVFARTADVESSAGTTQGAIDRRGRVDGRARAHAAVMVLAFLGAYPFGVLVLRLGGWVRWHAANQAVGLVLVVVGAGLGFAISGEYNRSKKFNTAHQVIGILVLVAVLAQFGLGIAHHRLFRRRTGGGSGQQQQQQQPTSSSRLAPYHVWLGRGVLLLGIVNGFLGFPLAQAPGYDWVLAGLVLVILPAVALLLATKHLVARLWRKSKEDAAAAPPGYDMEPWREADGSGGGGGGGGAAEVVGQHPEYPGAAPAPAYLAQTGRADLGPQHDAREYV
ncbi:hypothetical protein GGR56DRAFT_697684 [Xylariaceae sp. FL0804]|nr:hypothetical protein GGR56DRAFT_697684 [Xylariaceae sp. FL0804]